MLVPIPSISFYLHMMTLYYASGPFLSAYSDKGVQVKSLEREGKKCIEPHCIPYSWKTHIVLLQFHLENI